MAPCLCTLPVSEDHAVAHSARALFFLLLCLGRLIICSPKPEHRRNPVGHSLAGWSPEDAVWGRAAAGGAMQEAVWLQIRDEPSSCAYFKHHGRPPEEEALRSEGS